VETSRRRWQPRKIGPALAAGCPVVLKPAEDTPLTALALAALAQRRRGCPTEWSTWSPRPSRGPRWRRCLNDPRVRKLSFTGSTEVGRLLLAQAAKSVVSCSMSLGGNAPFIVFEDADIDAAVEGALIAKLRNGGEACTAGQPVLRARGGGRAVQRDVRRADERPWWSGPA